MVESFICRKRVLPTRAVIAIMMFTATFIAYTVRVNMSINIIAMVETSSKNDPDSSPECRRAETVANVTNVTHAARLTAMPDHGTRYEWDNKMQGLILGSFFWGFMLTCIPGGVLAEVFGATRTVLIATLLTGVLTLLGPLMASWHYVALIVSRFLVGLCGGVIYPCMHCLVSRWAPPDEKGRFVGALMGGTFGTVITWPVLGAIIENWGWTWSFLINGIVVLVWCIFWVLLVSDGPENHPHIDEDEKIFIAKSLANCTKKKSTFPPFKEIFGSVPFLALILLHFGNLWGLFFLMTGGPKYLSTVLGFDLGHTGFLAALPYLARMIFGFLFGFVGDFIRKKKLLSTTAVRKLFVVLSHIVPGLLVLSMNLVGCDVIWSVILLTLSLGSNGASTLTNLQNTQDLAPNYAGTLYGIINCFGSTTGFINPMIVGYVTQEHNGLNEWHQIFLIGAIVYIFTGVVFTIFGSGDVQRWNDQETISTGMDNPAFAPDNSAVKISEIENTKF